MRLNPGVRYQGLAARGVSWYDFRTAFIENGGDGIYGAWAVPYLEPVIAERQFVRRNQVTGVELLRR